MARLKTETNTPRMEGRIRAAFEKSEHGNCHHNIDTTFEHGQWYVTCMTCGAQWSVVDAEGIRAVDGFDFEEVSHGDEFCYHPDEHED